MFIWLGHRFYHLFIFSVEDRNMSASNYTLYFCLSCHRHLFCSFHLFLCYFRLFIGYLGGPFVIEALIKLKAAAVVSRPVKVNGVAVAVAAVHVVEVLPLVFVLHHGVQSVEAD